MKKVTPTSKLLKSPSYICLYTKFVTPFFSVKYECQSGENSGADWNSSGNDVNIVPDFDDEMIELATPNIILSD